MTVPRQKGTSACNSFQEHIHVSLRHEKSSKTSLCFHSAKTTVKCIKLSTGVPGLGYLLDQLTQGKMDLRHAMSETSEFY